MKEWWHLQLGIKAIENPLDTSKPPMMRRYHFDGILISNIVDNGNTFEYLTYSFLWKVFKERQIQNVLCIY